MSTGPRFFTCANGHDITVQSWGTVPRKCPLAICNATLTEVTANGNVKRKVNA